MTSLHSHVARELVAPHPVFAAALRAVVLDPVERIEPLCAADCEPLVPPEFLFNNRVRAIVAATAKLYGLKPEDIIGPYRSARFVRARRVAMYLARRRTRYSFPQLGRLFKKHHTSVFAAVLAIEDQRTIDAALAADLRTIEERLA